MRKDLVIAATGVALYTIALGCGEEPDVTPEDLEPTFESIQAGVFDVSCAFSSCHSVGGAAGNLVLEGEDAYDNLVRVVPDNQAASEEGLLRVDPNNPANSFLLVKLQTEVPEKYGDRMPRFSSPLEPSTIATIREWIERGAEPPTAAP